jgi:hypothetical protein
MRQEVDFRLIKTLVKRLLHHISVKLDDQLEERKLSESVGVDYFYAYIF